MRRVITLFLVTWLGATQLFAQTAGQTSDAIELSELDFVNERIINILGVLAIAGGVTILPDETVEGTATYYFRSTDFDEAAQASRTAFDTDERQQLLYQAQEILAADMPQVPLYIRFILNLYSETRFSGWVVHNGSGIINMGQSKASACLIASLMSTVAIPSIAS